MQLRRSAPTSIDWSELQAIIESTTDYNKRRYKCAQWYTKQGIHIIPFRQGKYAGTPPKSGIDFNTKPTLDDIKSWWHPQTGVYLDFDLAMPMGGQSGYCALDLDVSEEENKDGVSTLAEIEGSAGSWEEEPEEMVCWQQHTPSGGVHLIFKYHPEIGTHAMQSGATFKDIDTRGASIEEPKGNGGILFVAPTVKRDKQGQDLGTYRWETSRTECGDIPTWTVDALLGRVRDKLKMPEIFPQGQRDDMLYDYLLSCVAAGMKQTDLEDMIPELLARMVPPDERMIRKNIKSVMKSSVAERRSEEDRNRSIAQTMRLATNKDGRVLTTTENLYKILTSAPFESDFGFYYDEFLGEIMMSNRLDQQGRDYCVQIKLWISQRFQIEYSIERIRDMFFDIHRWEKPTRNCLREYIESCQIVPNVHAIQMLGDMLGFKGHENEAQYRAQLRVWLCGAVARGMQPGCEYQYMLVLIGEQGIGKSRALSALVPHSTWFTDAVPTKISESAGDKDVMGVLQGCWIVEMAEMTPFKNRRNPNAAAVMKTVLTQREDKYRPAYARTVQPFKRCCVFAGTSNTADVYSDVTGNRRYLTFDIGEHKIPVEHIADIRDLVWAEARDIYEAEREDCLFLSGAEEEVQTKLNRRAQNTNELMEAIEIWLRPRSRVATSEIVAHFSQPQYMSLVGRKDIEKQAKDTAQTMGWRNKPARVVDNAGNKLNRRVWINPKHPYEKLDKKGKENTPLTVHCLPEGFEEPY